MTIVLTILMIIGIIISVILITALILPKKYKVLREVTIQQPQQKVFDYIKYIRNQDGFSVWANTDPNMKKTYKGDDGRVGFVSAWESDNKKVVTALRFFKPFPGEAVAQFMTAPGENNSTKVSWQLDSAMKYPMNFMLLFINMDKMLGADMEKGLENLKNKLAE